MRYLVFTNTPAHVHLYRNAVSTLRERGHDVLVLARDYGCTVDLLEWYDLPFRVYGYCGTSKGSLVRRLPGHYARIFRRALGYDPDLVFGMGGYAAHAGFVTGATTVLVLDSEPTTLDHAVSRPFADAIITPDSFRGDLGDDHYVFPGFKECAYLHPEVYEPRPNVRSELGVGPDERYVLVRFNAFGSHHDIGEGGFTPEQRRTLVERLAASATVFVSDEGDTMDLGGLPARRFDIPPALMHDAISEASLLVADTQTIVTEAALLGTPVVRSNSFVGENDMGNFRELERAGLVRNVRSFERVIETVSELLADRETSERWRRRREEYVRGKVNLTEVIVETAVTGGAVDRVPALERRGRSAPTAATGGE